MNTFNKVIFLITALFLTANLKAQENGRIVGTVVDAETGETLIGVSIIIEGTVKGAATDIDGNYIIRNVSAGTYNLIVSYLSFSTQTITGLVVEEGDTKKLDIALQPESEFLDEIVVSAAAILNNEAGLLSQRQKSISFSDAISSENISNSGASDAAAAMTKVTGASVVGGKYVYVRGLGDRYTTTQLNGLELPTSDPDRKSFQLDLLPSGLLENIVTLKTFTPDKPGNFSGGLVDVTTRAIPENLFFNISIKQGYNTASSFQDILLGDKSDTDWLGYDSGYRSTPEVVDGLDNSEFPNETEARLNPDAAESLDQISRSFNTPFLPSEQSTILNQSYSIGFGNRHDLKNDIKLGYSLNYSYGMNYSAYDDGRQSRFQLLGQYEESEALSPNIDLVDIKGTQTVDWGLLGSFGLILGTSSKINFNFLQTQSGENSGRYLAGEWEQLNSDNAELRSRVNQYKERDLISYQASGKHNFASLNNLQIDWNTAYQTNGQEQPDLRFISSDARFVIDTNTGAVVDTVLGNDNSQHPRPARLFRDLNESKYSGTVDITIPISVANQTVKFKVGGLYENTERDFSERRFEYNQGRGFFLNQFDSEVEFLNSVGIIGEDRRGRPLFANYVQSATTNRSSYDAEQNINAVYGMIDFNILPSLKVATGIRYESTDLQTASRDTTLLPDDRFGSIDETDLLPSLILIYSITDRSNIRGAVTQTLARPTFREMTPYVSFDFVGDNLFRGNANLERTLITNYDLRWEWYPTPGEVFTVSGFYKKLENPIERVLRFDIAEKAESVQNVPEATVIGVEFEVRKNLEFLTSALSNFQLITNFTIVQSEVDIPEAELIQIRETQQNPETTRSLTGQSPYLVNVDLSYFNDENGLSSNLSYNVFGDRLSRVSQGAAPDIYERSYSRLNFNISKPLGEHFVLSLSANNLLDPEVTYSQIFKGNEYIYNQYRNGRTFSFGVKYNL
ncbi:MAG: TonB-dependent receptor [Balneolaceae bacterium]